MADTKPLRPINYVTSVEEMRTGFGFSSLDFPQVSQVMNMAIIKLGVRYPEVGCVMNNRSEMLIFIMSGRIKLFALSCGLWGEHLALPGMQVCVPRNTWYYWEPLEESMMLVFSSPPWEVDNQAHNLTPVVLW